MKVKVDLVQAMQFIGTGPSGHAVVMDAAQEVGGEDTATRPLELMLIALGGCTAMDVVSILRKMRTPARSLSVEIQAERAGEHPKAVRSAHLEYKAEGVPQDNLDKAVSLSHERYCSVSHSLSCTISWKAAALP